MQYFRYSLGFIQLFGFPPEKHDKWSCFPLMEGVQQAPDELEQV